MSQDYAILNEYYSQGKYSTLIKEMENPGFKKNAQGYYLLGKSYSKMQEFDKAIDNFSFALKANLEITQETKDIYYYLAQGYYAKSDLTTAIKQFRKSIHLKYMSQMSKYYIAVCYQKLEEYHNAISYFRKIKKRNNDLYQPAQFQLAKIMLDEIEKTPNPKSNIKRYILPALNRTLSINPDSKLASEIQQLIKETQNKYNLNPYKMINGRMVPEKRYTIRFLNSYLYDTNVVNEAENATQRASKKASSIGKTDLTLRYNFIYNQRFSLQPELKGAFTRHFVQNVPQVYRNDNYVIQPKILYGIEHSIHGKIARVELETNYYYQARDVNQIHRLEFFGSSFEYVLGERLEYFKIGETYFKIARKNFTGRSSSVDSYTHTFGLTQTINMPNSHMLLILINIDWLKTYLNTINSTNTYLGRVDYIAPNAFLGCRATGALSASIFDPLELRDGRGLEKNISPSIEIGRSLFSFGELNLKYAYIKNFSQNKTTFQYQKHVATFELNIRF